MSAAVDPALEKAALRLRVAAETGEACAPLGDLLAPGDLAAAYAVQDINTRHALSQGRRLIGRKIGLTSPAVQRQLGVGQPDFGVLFADMAYGSEETVPADAVLQPRAEAEIAFVLGRDLRHERHSLADVIGAVDYVLASIEIVGSRIADWQIGITDTIADNASSGALVLGSAPRALRDMDLDLCGMTLEVNGDARSHGVGRACLGNPLNAVRWLADIMVASGRPLQAGDVVLSGALGPMVAIAPGDRIDARISGLGGVSFNIGGA